MSPSTVLLLVFTILLLSGITTTAHNITRILDQYPDFAQFNALLSQTHLAEAINRRKTITVLALTNDRLGELSGKPDDVVRRILSTHVILDYFDLLKLNKLRGNHTILTTLYQATGTADDQQGFLDVAHNQGGIFFGSAMKGAPFDSKLEGSVATQPYNISVLSVSHVIIAPGIDGTWHPDEAPPPTPALDGAPPKVSPPAESPEDDLPADEPSAEEPALADPAAPGPSPTASGPTVDADAEENDAPPPPGNAAGRAVVSGASIGLAVALVSLWI